MELPLRYFKLPEAAAPFLLARSLHTSVTPAARSLWHCSAPRRLPGRRGHPALSADTSLLRFAPSGHREALLGITRMPAPPRRAPTFPHASPRGGKKVPSLTEPLPPDSSEANPASAKSPFLLPIRRPAAPPSPQAFPICSIASSIPVPSGLSCASRVPTPLPSAPPPRSPQDSLSRAPLHSPFPPFRSSSPSFPSARRTLHAVGLRGKVSQ